MGYSKWVKIVGFLLHLAVGGMMILAASGKLFVSNPDVIDMLKKHGLGDDVRLIGTGELVTAVLLILPWTWSLGLLLASSFWGGAICLHMSHNESYLIPAGLLVATWVGACLRNPHTLSSFTSRSWWG